MIYNKCKDSIPASPCNNSMGLGYSLKPSSIARKSKRADPVQRVSKVYPVLFLLLLDLQARFRSHLTEFLQISVQLRNRFITFAWHNKTENLAIP